MDTDPLIPKLEDFQFKLPYPQFKDTDRHRMFGYIPLTIFHKYTNIGQLITDEYIRKKGKKPLNVYVNRTVKVYHDQVARNFWNTPLLKQLDFNWPTGEKRYATIWTLNETERDKMHQKAKNAQKRFMYLPFHVIKNATNIMELLEDRAIKIDPNFKENSKNIDEDLDKVFQSIYAEETWDQFLDNLKFKEESAVVSKVNRAEREEDRQKEISTERTEVEKVKSLQKNTDDEGKIDARESRDHLLSHESKLDEAKEHQPQQIAKKDASRWYDIPKNAESSPQNVHTELTTRNENSKENIVKKSLTDKSQEPPNKGKNIETDAFSMEPQLAMKTESSEDSECSEEEDFEPSDFQTEVMAMNFFQFVQQTNARDLVRKEFLQQSKKVTSSEERMVLKQLFDIKNQPNDWKKWQKDGHRLKNLRPKCECQRRAFGRSANQMPSNDPKHTARTLTKWKRPQQSPTLTTHSKRRRVSV